MMKSRIKALLKITKMVIDSDRDNFIARQNGELRGYSFTTEQTYRYFQGLMRIINTKFPTPNHTAVNRDEVNLAEVKKIFRDHIYGETHVNDWPPTLTSDQYVIFCLREILMKNRVCFNVSRVASWDMFAKNWAPVVLDC